MSAGRVIEDIYDNGVIARTTPHDRHDVYEVFHNNVLVWSRLIYRVGHDGGHSARVRVAREMDAFATRLVKKT